MAADRAGMGQPFAESQPTAAGFTAQRGLVNDRANHPILAFHIGGHAATVWVTQSTEESR